MRTRGQSAKLCWTLLTTAVLALFSSNCATALDNTQLMDSLISAYPDFLAGHEGNELVWKDGTRMAFDDGKSGKSFDMLLHAPSLKDMFYTPYQLGSAGTPPALDADPGRVRYEPFFIKMYGDCRRGETEKTLVDVIWLPKKWGKPVRVTRVNGVAAQLAKVSAELDRLPANYDKYLFPTAGTLNCRVIAGTGRLSAHGTATAIDIATRHAHYWRWSKPDIKGQYVWRNEIPLEIVEIFERHGFIWGGKWYHFDTMHFEYRPELIAVSRRPQPVSPFPPVGTVAAPCGSPAVPHLRGYYGFVRLLAYPFLPPPVSLGGRYPSLRVCSLPWRTPSFPWDLVPFGSG